ncbi:MAG: hypothetical protein ABI954_02270 [Pyrinomonadaceae bacterium]
MSYSPLAIKRRNILGDLYPQCDTVSSIPVYMDDKSADPIGFVDESLGRYMDAFLFHLPEDVCKKLSSSSYDIIIDYDFSDQSGSSGENKRLKLNHILLIPKQLPRALPRRNANSVVKEVQ